MDYIVELLKTAFLGIVEGITEWLPVSSTGHMILVNDIMQLSVSEAFWNMFLVVIQLGAILAVVVLYFTRLNPWARSKTAVERKATWDTWGKILVGIIPAALVGIPLNDFMEDHLSTSLVVATALIVYGIAFIVIENIRARRLAPRGAHAVGAQQGEQTLAQTDPGIQTMGELSYKKALGIGCFQVLSLVPGTSRSGSTIIGGLLLGTSRTLAAEYSFFMAIPVMLGASLLRIVKFFIAGNVLCGAEMGIMAVGMIVAFATSIFTIKFLMRFVKTNDFKPFGVYRIILGGVIILSFLFF